MPWAVATVVTGAACFLGIQNYWLRNERTALRTERDLAEVAYRMTQTQLSARSLLAEKMINELGNKLRRAEDLSRLKISALSSRAAGDEEPSAIAVWDPVQQVGLLVVSKLPATAEARDCQVWITDSASAEPVSGGVFHVPAEGRVTMAFAPDRRVRQAIAFAISVEKKGGAPKAEGPLVLVGK